MTDNIMYLWDNLTDLGIATTEEIALVCARKGTTEDTLNDILYVRTGYRSLEQYMEEN